MQTYGIALSGLRASELRLANSANNIANLSSTSRLAQGRTLEGAPAATEVTQSSVEPTGGVRASVQDKYMPTVKVYAPEHPDAGTDGMLELPNVSLEEEAVQQKLASYDYKANLRVIKTQDEMDKSLLDIKS